MRSRRTLGAIGVHQRRGDPECSQEVFLRCQGRERHHRKCEQKKTCFWRLLKDEEESRRKCKRDGGEEERRILTKPPATVLI